MGDHTRLSRRLTNTDGTGFTPTRGIASPISNSVDSFAPQPTIAPSQTAPEIALSPQQETEQAQESSDSSALDSLPGHDFSKIALTWGEGQAASQGEEPPDSRGNDRPIQRKSTSFHQSPSVGHDFSQVAVTLQAKLTVSQPDDPYEQEADRVAEQVMRMPEAEDAPTESVPEFSGHDFSQISILPQLQPAAEPVEVSRGLEQQLTQSQGGGNPLADETRTFMEPRLGADLSAVRVHTDTSAAQMNQALNAQAFTHGNDIYFGAGTSPGKNDLTAHELTHTIQQTGGMQAETLKRRSHPGKKLQAKADPNQSILQRRKSTSERNTNPNPERNTEDEAPETPAASMTTPAAPVSESAGGQSAQPVETVQPVETRAKIDSSAAISPSASQPAPSPDIPTSEQTVSPPGQPANSSDSAAANSAPITDRSNTGSPASAQADPEFQAVTDRSKAAASQQKEHPPAGTKATEAQAAAESPESEIESKAQDRQVQEADQQQPGTFDAKAFKTALLDAIAAIVPTNEKAADEFKENNQIDSVGDGMSSQVTDEQKRSAESINNKVKENPDRTGIDPKPVNPLQPNQPGAPPADIDARKAAPKPKQDAEVAEPLAEDKKRVDQQMAESNITDEQLAKSNEPEFLGALDAKKQADTQAAAAPADYRQKEEGVVSQAQTEAQTTAQTHLQEMHGERAEQMNQVGGLQGETKGKDEQERSKVAGDINSIYEKTKTDVESILNGLDTEVTRKFDAGAETAERKFEDYVGKKMDAYKRERYGEWFDITGWDERVSDFFTSLPPEVDQFFVDGREEYLREMDIALTEIATLVADKLNQAKQRIAEGKQEIQKYVVSLPQSLQKVGQEAAKDIQGKFEELEQSVQNKHDELIETLAQKYQEKLKQLDDRIEQMKEENKGAFDKAADLIDGVIKTISEIKAKLEQILAEAMAVIAQIIQDPIGFLDNLLKALNQGFNQFLENIGEHLQSGLIGWLTGAMGTAGIQMPENIFSLEGIFSLAAQILGLGWEFIRDKAVGMFGESTVTAMEENVDIFQTLKNDGLKGLWQQIQSQFTDLKETVMDEIQSILTVEVIKAGITWILSLFNPASAFIRAAKMIVDVIIFFVENASQIIELVQSVIQSIAAIASGSIGAAADAIENALARAVPVLIGFLASLLGIGGLANKVKDVFERIRKRIDDAIEKLLKKVKQLFKGKTGKDNEEENDKDKNDQDKNDKDKNEENVSDVTPEKQRDVEDATPRQDADNVESDRDITSPSSDRRRKSNEEQSDEDASVDAPDRQRPKDYNEDTDTTPDAKPDRHDDQEPDTKRDRHDDQDTDITLGTKRDRQDDQEPDAPQRDKADQPDQRKRDQDDPDQPHRKDRDQDGDSSPDRKRDRDSEDGDRKDKDNERTEQEKQADLDKGLDEAETLLENEEISFDEIKKRLPGIKSTYRMTRLELIFDDKNDVKETAHVHGEVNPVGNTNQASRSNQYTITPMGEAELLDGGTDSSGGHSAHASHNQDFLENHPDIPTDKPFTNTDDNNRSVFPVDWFDEDIISAVIEAAKNSDQDRKPQANGRYEHPPVSVQRKGISVKVVVISTADREIWTAWPVV